MKQDAPARSLALSFLAISLLGCEPGESVCTDYSPNAQVSWVRHDPKNDVLYVAATRHNSYCSGTEEQPFTTELITISLASHTVASQLEQTDDPAASFPTPPNTPWLFWGEFGNGSCKRCELSIGFANDAQSQYTAIFYAAEYPATPLLIEIRRDGERLFTVESGDGPSGLQTS